MGAVGLGLRGKFVLERFTQNPVDVRALCDVWSTRIDQAQPLAAGAKAYRDYRKMIESEKLDAVLAAVPDHWHAQVAMDAMTAGLDVYVEKPLTFTIDEGPRILRTARVNGRICQVGTQARSNRNFLQLKTEYFDSGRLGKIALVRTWYNGNSGHLQKAPDNLKTQPDNLDWAKFLGPVKWREWDPQQYWNWRAYLDFGGGQIGDLFVHLVDAAHMLLGKDNPVSAVASGGVFYYKDGRTAPDTITLALQYPSDLVVTFEGSLVPGTRVTSGLEFSGAEGSLQIDWSTHGGTVFFPPGRGAKPTQVLPAAPDATLDHVRNFLECVRTRKLPNADVYIGHRSAEAAHIGKLAYLEQRRVKFDPERGETLPLAYRLPGSNARPGEEV